MTEKDIIIQTSGDSGKIIAMKKNGAKEIGEVLQLEDGFWYYWHTGTAVGATEAWVLRAIADRLDELNKPWNDIIDRQMKEDQEKRMSIFFSAIQRLLEERRVDAALDLLFDSIMYDINRVNVEFCEAILNDERNSCFDKQMWVSFCVIVKPFKATIPSYKKLHEAIVQHVTMDDMKENAVTDGTVDGLMRWMKRQNDDLPF